MEFKGQYEVIGVKGNKGNYEGTDYDYTKLRVRMDVSEKNGTEFGYDVKEMPVGKSDELAKYKDLPFPIMAELTIVLTTKGPEVTGFKALSQSKPAA